MRFVLAALIGLTASVGAQQPTIEMRKVRTLIDQDGKGFTRAPMSVAPIANGRYAVAEMNELPIVVDATGRLVKRWAKGEGPGEFQTNAGPVRVGKGDTLYVGNINKVNIFDRDLKFVRAMSPTGTYVGNFLPIGGQFVVAAQRHVAGSTIQSLHVTDKNGAIIRSFQTDTLIRPRRGNDPQYDIGRGGGDTFWAWNIWDRELQQWNLEGRRLMTIDTTPAWFVQKDPVFKARIQSVSEADGILWVFSSVPVPDVRAKMQEAIKGKTEVDGRAMPFEQMSTAYLEAFDARTGKRIAELSIKAYGVGFVDDRHFMTYSTSANDTAQLDIWEMKLKR